MGRTFDGVSGTYAQFNGAVISAAPITMAAWFHTSSITANQTLMSLFNSADNLQYLALEAAGADTDDLIKVRARAGGTIASGVSGSGYSADTWTHAAGLFESSTSRYAAINGVKGAQQTSTRAPTLDRTQLAAQFNGTRLAGILAEAAMWNVMLTDAELAALAAGACPLLIRPSGLIAYWPLVGGNSPEIELFGRSEMTLNGTTSIAEHPRIYYGRTRSRGIFVPSGGASTYTGAGACTAGAATCSGSATFTAPTYSGTAAVSIAPATASGSATFTAPTYTGAAAVTIAGATAAGSGTVTNPTYTAAAAVTVAPATASGSAIFANAVYQGTAVVSIAPATASGSATFTAPTYTGAAAVSAAPAVCSGSAIFSASISIGAAAVTVAGATCSGVATFTAAVVAPAVDGAAVAVRDYFSSVPARSFFSAVAER